MGRAHARIHIEHDAARRPSTVHEVDPSTRQIGQRREVRLCRQPMRLEAAHLAGRSRIALRRLAANDPAHCRIMTQAFGVVHVFVSGEPTEYRLPQHPDQVMAAVLAGPRVREQLTRHRCQPERVVAFYNKRGTCEQWIKEGKGAIKWTRLSCRTFAANAVRLQLHALAYNLGNFLRTLATPEPIKDWSLTSLKEKLIKIGAKVVSHGRYVIFQMAEVAIPRQMFQEILRLIAELRPQPPPALA